MSISEPLPFDRYSPRMLWDHFKIDSARGAVRDAMTCKYNLARTQIPQDDKHYIEYCQKAAQMAIKAIEYPYDLCQEFCEDFFPENYTPDMDAIMISIIMGEDMEHFNSATESKAVRLWEMTCQHCLGEVVIEEDNLYIESVFTAHILAFIKIREWGEKLDSIDATDADEFLDETLPIYEDIASKGRMGEKLKELIQMLEELLVEKSFCAQLQPPPLHIRPPLTLVPKS